MRRTSEVQRISCLHARASVMRGKRHPQHSASTQSPGFPIFHSPGFLVSRSPHPPISRFPNPPIHQFLAPQKTPSKALASEGVLFLAIGGSGRSPVSTVFGPPSPVFYLLQAGNLSQGLELGPALFDVLLRGVQQFFGVIRIGLE